MLSRITLVTVFLLLASTAMVQAAVVGMPMQPIPYFDTRNMTMKVTANGLYIIGNGTVARYEAKTLNLLGAAPLLDPLPAQPTLSQPATQPEMDALNKWQQERMLRSLPAITIPQGDFLLIVWRQTFLRVNQKTLKVEAITPLAKPADPAKPNQGFNNQPPMLELAGQTPQYVLGPALYVILNDEVISLDPVNGAIIARAPLAKELATTTGAFYGGGWMQPGGGVIMLNLNGVDGVTVNGGLARATTTAPAALLNVELQQLQQAK